MFYIFRLCSFTRTSNNQLNVRFNAIISLTSETQNKLRMKALPMKNVLSE
jgi:hypothetical protein